MIVFEVRVSLLGVEPPVWRRVRVPGDFYLRMVHLALQMVMGWENCHLHEFVAADRKRYGALDGDEVQEGVLDENSYRFSDLMREPGERCLYIYDFGDDWVHELVLEAIVEVEPQDEPMWCLEGSGACPPEDCGGVPGYFELLAQLHDSSDEEHDAAVALLGEGFDPEVFDCNVFNEQVRGKFSMDSEMKVPEEVRDAREFLSSLQDFLMSDAVPDSAMSILALDGFFSALAIYPVTIMPNQWLPVVMDMSREGKQPEFASKAEAETGMGLLFSYMNAVVRQLTDDPFGYMPLFEDMQIDSDEEAMLAAEDWASGFVLGAMIDQNVWERTFSDEEGGLLMTSFAAMSGLFDEETGSSQEELADMKEELMDELGDCVRDLQEFWAPWRRQYLAQQSAGRTVKAAPHAGRNDPCPCGSGKKYKQCCGR